MGLCRLPRLNAPPLVLGAAIALALLLSSCGSHSDRKTLYATKGELFVSGQPAVGAMVVFHPQSADSPEEWPTGFPHAVVAEGGKFVVGTYDDHDGCPSGNYIIEVTWPAAAAEAGQDEEAETIDRLQGRYATKDNSPLKATVDGKPTELPRFNLQ